MINGFYLKRGDADFIEKRNGYRDEIMDYINKNDTILFEQGRFDDIIRGTQRKFLDTISEKIKIFFGSTENIPDLYKIKKHETTHSKTPSINKELEECGHLSNDQKQFLTKLQQIYPCENKIHTKQ